MSEIDQRIASSAKCRSYRGTAVSVLLAEDEESFVDALVVGLAREGFDVTIARDGPEALAKFEEIQPDLVLLDIMLPKLSGIDVCRAIRARLHGPDHHGHRKGDRDRHCRRSRGRRRRLRDQALPAARARGTHARGPAALTGARDGLAQATGTEPREAIEVGDVRVDTDRRKVLVRGDEVQLRRKEFDLLLLLVENAGRVLTRDTLIDRVWGTDYVGDTKTLDVHIKRLRAHLEADRGSPTLITTVRGVGYRFELPRGLALVGRRAVL